MFVTLLAITFLVALLVAFVVVRAFSRPIDSILRRLISDDITTAWLRYMKFAIYVVGVSSGVRIHELEKYITPNRWQKDAQVIDLTSDRWILELYRTVIETLQGAAWLLLVFFIFALIAYVIVRAFELRKRSQNDRQAL